MNIRKRIPYIAVMTMLLFSFCLQGCSIKKAETNYDVSVDKTGKKVTIELKADKSEGYKWYFYTETGALIKSSTDLDRDDILSETRISKCTFTADEASVTDTIYMILVKDGDVDGAKAYICPVSYNEDIHVSVGKISEKTVGLNKDIKSKVAELVGSGQ